MKVLDGKELAGFIKERQAKQVRALRQTHDVIPRLAIIRTNPDPVVDSYMKLKTSYGRDILVEVDVHTIDQSEAVSTIAQLNNDSAVHGIIVQIPLPDPAQTDEILNAVAPEKDVDGLGRHATFDPATPMAINWLLAGYNIDLRNKKVVLIGRGRLVGAPLERVWKTGGIIPVVADRKTADLASITKDADVIVTATGKPGLLTAAMVSAKAVIVDAGVATDTNGLVGDVAVDVRQLPDITITPEKGGVGPLTVCALFENVIHAASVTK